MWGFALSTGIRPRVIQYPLRTPLKLYLPASLSVVLVGVFGSPSFVVLVCWRGLVFVWLGLFGFSVCWWFRAVFSFCVLRLMASPDVSLDWDIYILLSPAPLRP